MSAATPNDADIPPRGKVKDPFCLIGNHDFDVFLPIMGADCFTIYAYFVRRVFSDPKLKHSVRGLADVTGLGITTVLRSLEIMEYLRLVKLTRFGGGKDSECQLLDSREVASRLGAQFHRRALSFSLPPQVAQRLKAEVKALRKKQQGRSSQMALSSAPHNCGNLTLPVSQRNASVSPAIRQRSTRETQTGTHLLQEERRIENVPSPTPSHEQAVRKPKDLPNDEEPEVLLKCARTLFNGAIDEIRAHLLDANRPPVPHLANGFADWQEFGFGSLAVKAAARRGKGLALVLSATDPAAARRGLEKYQRTWEASIRKWYGCKVLIELQRAEEMK